MMTAIASNTLSHSQSLHISSCDHKTVCEQSMLLRNLRDKGEINFRMPGHNADKQLD